jgi:hypothetical protein
MLLILISFLLSKAFASTPECGLRGKLEQRIADCNEKANNAFTLVSRDRTGREVFLMNVLDTNVQTGERVQYNLLWSAVNPNKMNARQAMNACRGPISEALGLLDYNWRLPTMNEFLAAYWAGVENRGASRTRNILNLGDKLLYTSEFNEYNMPWMFDDIMDTGYRYFVPVAPSETHHVICVSSVKMK